MLQLPQNKNLDIGLLAACFNKKTTSYKFYWFLSIIQAVETGKTLIDKKEIFARMISNAWYTHNYFKISFGVQDQLHKAIEKIKESEELTVDAKQDKITDVLLTSSNKQTLKALDHFDSQVPHWFLSPWFPGKSEKEIYKASNDSRNKSPYALAKQFISVNLLWANYFMENAAVLKAFCYWKLALFLQARNPSVPDIPNKLIKPAVRNSLTAQRKGFWDIVLDERPDLKCIYSKKPLQRGKYAVEHFVPYSFVSHDLIWNLIPADASFNSSKSDRLPPMERYFNPFFQMQQTAIRIMLDKKPESKFLEEYLTIFPDLQEAVSLDINFTSERFRERIQPLISIAANNGFEFMQ